MAGVRFEDVDLLGALFEDVDLLGALSRIVDLHTQHYKEDFDLDKELIKTGCVRAFRG